MGEYLNILVWIDTLGNVKKYELHNLKYPRLEKEVDKFISLMPKWNPATNSDGTKCELSAPFIIKKRLNQ
jgi:hypothetical protein